MSEAVFANAAVVAVSSGNRKKTASSVRFVCAVQCIIIRIDLIELFMAGFTIPPGIRVVRDGSLQTGFFRDVRFVAACAGFDPEQGSSVGFLHFHRILFVAFQAELRILAAQQKFRVGLVGPVAVQAVALAEFHVALSVRSLYDPLMAGNTQVLRPALKHFGEFGPVRIVTRSALALLYREVPVDARLKS